NLNTDGGLNNNADDANFPQQTAGAGDWAYGGDGLDVMIADSGYDRMYDWGGEFNSFVVPFARFGEPTVNRLPNPHIQAFLTSLAAAAGTDQAVVDPNFVAGDAEIALFDQSSPLWGANHGAPRDPQPGNNPKGNYDAAGSPEDDTVLAPLQTAAGSTPTSGRPPAHGPDHSPPPTGRVLTPAVAPPTAGHPAAPLQKDVNAADPLHPTAAENANDPLNPRLLPLGTTLVWTYLLTNPGNVGLTLGPTPITDDAGTPTVPGDDFTPKYVSGDANSNRLLDPGETWLYTSQGVVAPKVVPGFYGNTATVTATGNGSTVTAFDSAYHFGTNTLLVIQKDINAVDPLHPTTAEDANDAANPRQLLVGTNVVWTYLLPTPGTVAMTVASVRDDAGTPTLPGDDFTPLPVLQTGTTFNVGDTNKDGMIQPGEAWLYTSQGAVTYK